MKWISAQSVLLRSAAEERIEGDGCHIPGQHDEGWYSEERELPDADGNEDA